MEKPEERMETAALGHPDHPYNRSTRRRKLPPFPFIAVVALNTLLQCETTLMIFPPTPFCP